MRRCLFRAVATGFFLCWLPFSKEYIFAGKKREDLKKIFIKRALQEYDKKKLLEKKQEKQKKICDDQKYSCFAKSSSFFAFNVSKESITEFGESCKEVAVKGFFCGISNQTNNIDFKSMLL